MAAVRAADRAAAVGCWAARAGAEAGVGLARVAAARVAVRRGRQWRRRRHRRRRRRRRSAVGELVRHRHGRRCRWQDLAWHRPRRGAALVGVAGGAAASASMSPLCPALTGRARDCRHLGRARRREGPRRWPGRQARGGAPAASGLACARGQCKVRKGVRQNGRPPARLLAVPVALDSWERCWCNANPCQLDKTWCMVVPKLRQNRRRNGA